MANHKSSEKRIRQTEARRLRNRYYAKTARNAVRKLRKLTDKAEALALYPKVVAILDRLASKKAISKNKASNLKSKLAKHIAKLAA
ncbi:30S ribosomal protein S20 [uncultured Duncaniella sp.]|jgi:small subunit ribosomal protein S20|uniref:30S ribosomal protein S20 n=1 Tax=uncultured Duncaniella sp. TaxID=2768039 RepID=UPI00265A9ABF|nr:30S ribosomal protein S20 [uncultured Duncaniella sp.]